jgi:single-stranded-DNA-specific exonuclease
MYDWSILSNPKDLGSLKNTLFNSRLGNFNEEEFISPPKPVELLNSKHFDLSFFENLKKGKELIQKAISSGKLILIHGDYDADGVCATSIIYQTIKHSLDYPNVLTLIPDRFEDGYGLSDKTVSKLLDLAFNQKFLLITVDCGITSVNQVKVLKDLGNEVLITDHHHASEALPPADVIIWNDKIVGSAISWLLSLGLGNKDPKIMSLAAVATVTDVFPLLDFNRALIWHGLKILRDSPPLSIQAILESNNKNYKEVTVYEIGFVIGPRLNSSGRIGSADTSLELLNSVSQSKAWELVSVINEINIKRQKITEESLAITDFSTENLPNVLIVFNENFHEGVMGLIASKLVQKYNRPSLVISKNGDHLKGSARSIKGINIIEILKEFSSDFISVGGHELAAGFSLAPEKLELVTKKITDYITNSHRDFNFNKTLGVFAEVESSLLNFDLLNLVSKLEPFGNGNEEPLFCIRNLSIKNINPIGAKKNHLSLKLSNGIREFKGLIFNFDKDYYSLYLGLKIDIVCKIRKNEYNGNVYLDLNIIDLKTSNA